MNKSVLLGSVTQVITLHPKHIVMCVGNGRQNIPQFKDVDKFKGSLYHSDQHKDVKRWAGKKAVVVGAVSIQLTEYCFVYSLGFLLRCSVTPQATQSSPSSLKITAPRP